MTLSTDRIQSDVLHAAEEDVSASADGSAMFASSSQLSSFLQQVTSVGPSNASADVLVAALSELCKLALSAGKLGRTASAMQKVEHGLALAAGREDEHPAISIEVARVRLNFGWLLSCSGRHLEAVAMIAEAHKLLRRVIAWSDECSHEDASAMALGVEAASLQSAAALAEAVELEPLALASACAGASAQAESGSKDASSDSTAIVVHDNAASSHKDFLQRYARACSFAESRLPRGHPTVLTARRLCRESQKYLERLPTADAHSRPRTTSPSSPAALPQGDDRPHTTPARPGLPELRYWGKAAQKKNAPFARRGALVKSMKPDGEGVTAPSKGMVKKTLRRSFSSFTGGLFPKEKGGPKDIFTAYIQEDKFEKDMRWEMRMGVESRQEDRRKQLYHQRRLVNLAGNANRMELGDVRYSAVGHKMQMKGLMKGNTTRSAPNLMLEAKVLGKSPEAYHMHTLAKDFRPTGNTAQERRRISLVQLALRNPLTAKE
mmetsp:Transcript_29077/g.66884  ORF Transcript_29077/g.66884 Transcript_29077/m.66884 type:complete len:492 (-) Transcript_29077:16-1491(-)